MRMTHPLTRVSGRSYEPAELKELMSVFDEVWASVTSDGFARGDEIFERRTRLATIILHLARDGQLGPLQIARTAGRLMRQGQPLPTGERPS